MASFCKEPGCGAEMYICQVCGKDRCSVDYHPARVILGTYADHSPRYGNACYSAKIVEKKAEPEAPKLMLDDMTGEALVDMLTQLKRHRRNGNTRDVYTFLVDIELYLTGVNVAVESDLKTLQSELKDTFCDAPLCTNKIFSSNPDRCYLHTNNT